MCQTHLGQIITLNPPFATIVIDEAEYTVNTVLIKEPLAIGDHVLVHAGFATGKVDEQTAAEIDDLFKEMNRKQ